MSKTNYSPKTKKLVDDYVKVLTDPYGSERDAKDQARAALDAHLAELADLLEAERIHRQSAEDHAKIAEETRCKAVRERNAVEQERDAALEERSRTANLYSILQETLRCDRRVRFDAERERDAACTDVATGREALRRVNLLLSEIREKSDGTTWHLAHEAILIVNGVLSLDTRPAACTINHDHWRDGFCVGCSIEESNRALAVGFREGIEAVLAAMDELKTRATGRARGFDADWHKLVVHHIQALLSVKGGE